MLQERSVALLTETERAILRGLSQTGSVGATAIALGRNLETTKYHLKAARQKLGVGSSIEAAALLAHAERRYPSWGAPERAVGTEVRLNDSEVVDRLPLSVRDGDRPAWGAGDDRRPPDGDPGADRVAWLGKALWVAVCIVCLLAVLTYVMLHADRIVAWNTFQP